MQEFIDSIKQLTKLSTEEIIELRSTLAQARVEALQGLWEQRAKVLVPKDPQWTELDRKTMLEGFTAEHEKDYLILVALEEIVADFVKTQVAGGQEPSR